MRYSYLRTSQRFRAIIRPIAGSNCRYLGISMLRRSLPVAAALAIAFPAIGQAQTSTITNAWVQNDRNSTEGQAFFARSATGCFLLTAGHVVNDNGDLTETVTYRVGGSTAKQGKPQWAPLDPTKPDAFDVGVIEVSKGDAPTACPAIPSGEQIDKALSKGEAEIIFAARGSARKHVPVKVIDESPSIIVRPVSPQDQIQEGMSGSPLIVDGIAIGLVSSVDNQNGVTNIRVVRLDAAPIEARAYLAIPTGQPTTALPSGMPAAEAARILGEARQARPATDTGQVAALQVLTLSGKAASGLDLAAMGFQKADLSKLVAADADLSLSDLSGANAEDADLSGTQFSFSVLSGAKFSRANLTASFGSLFVAEDARFDGAKLERVGWRGTNLARASFEGASLNGASITFSDLRGANFRNARFSDLVLIGSDLRGARFDQVKARSIDVTGAVFDDNTFPASVASVLCGTRNTASVDLIVREDLVANPRVRSDSTDLAERAGDITLRHRADRFFPRCPARTVGFGKDYDAMIDQPEQQGETETVHPRLVVDIQSALLRNPARRDRVVRGIQTLVADAKARDQALDSSNRYYRERPALLLAQVKRNLAAARFGPSVWLNDTTLVFLAAKYAIEPLSTLKVIQTRFLPERFKEDDPLPRRTRDNWTMLFPEGMTSSDFSTEIETAVGTWSKAMTEALPASVRYSVVSGDALHSPVNNMARQITLEDVLSPYKAALHDENYQRYMDRWTGCMQATNPYDPPAMRAEAQKKMGYSGRSEDECRWAANVEPDRKQIFGGDWYVGRSFVELTAGGDNRWTLAVPGMLRPELFDRNGAMRTGVISGKIGKVIKLKAAGGTSYSNPDGKLERRIIVLDDARFDIDQ